MKLGHIVRFAPLLLVLASGVSGLRPRRSLLPDVDHGFLRGEDGAGRLPDIIMPPTGSRHLTINGACERCCDGYGRDGCYLCKTSKSGKKHQVRCTAKTSKSEKKIYHDGHDRIEDTHQCGIFIDANCYHEGHPCTVAGGICADDEYCPPTNYAPYGNSFCPATAPDPTTCPCPTGILSTYYRDVDGDQFGNPTGSVMACSPPDGYVEDGTDCDDSDAAVLGFAICGACGVLPYADEGDIECPYDGSQGFYPNSRYQGNANFLVSFDEAPCNRINVAEYRLILPQYPNPVLTLQGGDEPESGDDEARASWMRDGLVVRFFLLDTDTEEIIDWTSSGICFEAEGEINCPCPDDLNAEDWSNYQLGSVYWRTGNNNIPVNRMVLVVINGVVADVLPRNSELYAHFFSDGCTSYILDNQVQAPTLPTLVLNGCGVPDYNHPLFTSRCYPSCDIADHHTHYFQNNDNFPYGFDAAPCDEGVSTYNLELPSPYDGVGYIRNSNEMIDNSGVKFYLLNTDTLEIVDFAEEDRMCFIAEGEEKIVESDVLNMVDEGDWNDYLLGSAYYCGSDSFFENNKVALVLVNGRIAGTYPHDPRFFSSECSGYIADLIGYCGNGDVWGPEECDDGNSDIGDGCESDCTYTQQFYGCQGQFGDPCSQICTFRLMEDDVNESPFCATKNADYGHDDCLLGEECVQLQYCMEPPSTFQKWCIRSDASIQALEGGCNYWEQVGSSALLLQNPTGFDQQQWIRTGDVTTLENGFNACASVDDIDEGAEVTMNSGCQQKWKIVCE